MKLVPLGDKVIVQRTEAQETTSGGIVLPDVARTRSQRGKVLSVGEGRRLDNGELAMPGVREGDRVIFSLYAGDEVQLDEDVLLVMCESDILAVIE